MSDPFFPPERYTYLKSNFIRALDDDAIAAIAELAGKRPSLSALLPLSSIGVALLHAYISDTAFPHRNYSYKLVLWSNWEASFRSLSEYQMDAFQLECTAAISCRGSYGNYPSDEGDSVTRAA